MKVTRMSLTLLVALTLAACGGPARGGGLTVVASFYPLAFAAGEISGPKVEVIDLTPPGTEAHDVELSLDDRAALQEADVVLYLGDVGFQPQIEGAVADAAGRVVAVGPPGIADDPHFWLSPPAFRTSIDRIRNGLGSIAPAGSERRAEDLLRRIEELDAAFREGLASCERSTIIVTHEAFGWVAEEYGLRQIGLAGLSPEGEPKARSLVEAESAVAAGEATAVLYERTAEGERIGRAVADDLGVEALPLSTLESQPEGGDYVTVMKENLEALMEGLGCR